MQYLNHVEPANPPKDLTCALYAFDCVIGASLSLTSNAVGKLISTLHAPRRAPLEG